MKRASQKVIKRLFSGQRGFTLVEMIVALGIMGIIVPALGLAIFQMTNFTSRGNAQLATNDDLGVSMRWLDRDIQMAQTTDLVDAAPPVGSLTLNWTDEFGGAAAPHTTVYSLVGTELTRTYDGNTHSIARDVSSVQFSIQSKLLTVTLTSVGNRTFTSRRMNSAMSPSFFA